MKKERRPIVITHVGPALEDGRYPVKREVGDRLTVTADIFKEGHAVLAAAIVFRAQDESAWRESPMRLVDNDGWAGEFPLDSNTRYQFTLEAWTDVFASWAEDTARRRMGGQADLTSEILEGVELVHRSRSAASGADAALLDDTLARLESAGDQAAKLDLLLAPALRGVVSRRQERRDTTRFERELEVVVDRPRARFASWYELFPRSQSQMPGRHGTFEDCITRLPDVRRMGFDVVYLPPIHPIGHTGRKGRNNALVAGPDDPGSPWAIGGPEGGHTAVHPQLGTLEDFRRLVAAAGELDIEIALDLAFQCSPDHPWLREQPDWFYRRPDGTIRYAENPPKKYEDIVPINFSSPAWEALWDELLRVVLFWVEQGVRIFRVDNPHTKPFDFWQWLIREVQDRHPEVIFLAEAFTRPKIMQELAKTGFSQSYTYFTWRNSKEELTQYFRELTSPPMVEYFRGNLFVNTPDILSEVLQRAGRPAFKMRAALAATLSPLWGIYSGFELCESEAVAPGSEEYANSEKYEIRVRDWDSPGHIKDHIGRLNAVRRENRALQSYRHLRFYRATGPDGAESPHVLFYGKLTPDRGSSILVAINLDPFAAHEATLHLPLEAMGMSSGEPCELHELLSDGRSLVREGMLTVTLNPAEEPAVIYRVEYPGDRPPEGGR
jgi:starch synthase (maltosyl-transferring)